MTVPVGFGEIALVLTKAKETRVYYNSNDHYTSGYIDLLQSFGLDFIMITQNNGVRKQHLLGELKRYDIRPIKPTFVIDEIGEYLTRDGRKAFVLEVHDSSCCAYLEGDGDWHYYSKCGIPIASDDSTIVEKVKGYGPK